MLTVKGRDGRKAKIWEEVNHKESDEVLQVGDGGGLNYTGARERRGHIWGHFGCRAGGNGVSFRTHPLYSDQFSSVQTVIPRIH